MTDGVLGISRLTVEASEVYRYLGVRDERPPSPATTRLVAQACALGRDLLQPAASRVWRQAAYQGSLVEMDDRLTLDTDRPLGGWQGLERVAICLCTIGPALEGRVTGLFQEDEAPLAVALDAFGSAAMDALSERIRRIVCTEAAAMGMGVGPQGEPGIGQWSLRDQAVLFRIAASPSLGIRLTDDCMLIPRKSLCFVVPAGSRLESSAGRSSCQSCSLVSCAYRRT